MSEYKSDLLLEECRKNGGKLLVEGTIGHYYITEEMILDEKPFMDALDDILKKVLA